MKAAVVNQFNDKLEVKKVDRPSPGIGEVLIKMEA